MAARPPLFNFKQRWFVTGGLKAVRPGVVVESHGDVHKRACRDDERCMTRMTTAPAGVRHNLHAEKCRWIFFDLPFSDFLGV